jgi:predicted nucleic acid-binding protein
MLVAYVDTSAFIKRFLREARTEDMDELAESNDYRLAISSLVVTELRSVFKRNQRLGLLNDAFVQQATQQLHTEIASGGLRFHAMDAAIFNLAGDLISRLASPLGTLDALHLACAQATGADLMVSADLQLLRASEEAGLKTLNLVPHKA